VDYKRVTRRFVTPDQPVIELSLEDEEGGIETIGVTAEHPFRVKARGWIGAGALLPGDEVFTSTGGRLKVTGSTWLSKRQTVYNLEVEGYHTYFVGDVGAWVHNTCHVPASKKGVFPKSPKQMTNELNVDPKAIKSGQRWRPSDKVKIEHHEPGIHPGEPNKPGHYHVSAKQKPPGGKTRWVRSRKPDGSADYHPGDKYPGN